MPWIESRWWKRGWRESPRWLRRCRRAKCRSLFRLLSCAPQFVLQFRQQPQSFDGPQIVDLQIADALRNAVVQRLEKINLERLRGGRRQLPRLSVLASISPPLY